MIVAGVWKRIGSPDLSPFAITLYAWDNHPSQPLGLYKKYHIIVFRKIVSIDNEVIDAPLHYKIIFGCSYTYAMLIFASALIIRCASLIMERSSLLINWRTMIPNIRLHLNPISHQWLILKLSHPLPISLLESTKVPSCFFFLQSTTYSFKSLSTKFRAWDTYITTELHEEANDLSIWWTFVPLSNFSYIIVISFVICLM